MSVAGLMAASYAVQAAGAYAEGQANAKMANYNADVAKQNQGIAKAQAAEEERRFRRSSAKYIGSMRAKYGAAGVDLSGSPMDVLEETASMAELDALTIKYEGELRVRDYEIEEASMRYQAKTSKIGSYLGASGHLLSSSSYMGRNNTAKNRNSDVEKPYGS